MRLINAFRNFATGIGLSAIKMIAKFIELKLILQTYGPALNGLHMSVKQLLAYATLLEVGLSSAIIFYLFEPLAQKDYKTVNEMMAAGYKMFKKISDIYIVLLIITSCIYPWVVKNDTIYSFAGIAAIVFIMGLPLYFTFKVEYMVSFLNIACQVRYYDNIYNLIIIVIELCTIIFLIQVGQSIIVLLLVNSLLAILMKYCYSYFVRGRFKWYQEVTEYNMIALSKTGSAMYHRVAYLVDKNSSNIILSIFSGFRTVNLYGIYNSIFMGGVDQLLGQMNKAVQGAFGDMFARDDASNSYRKFSTYQFIVLLYSTVLISAILLSIFPFLLLYLGLEYIDFKIGFLFVVMYYLESLKRPQVLAIYSSGKFEETKSIMLIQAILNITLSIALVRYYSIYGVLIGAIVSSTINYFLLLKHNYYEYFAVKQGAKNTLLQVTVNFSIVLLFMILVSSYNPIVLQEINSFYLWSIYGLLCLIWSLVLVVSVNFIFYWSNMLEIVSLVRSCWLCKRQR